MKDIERKRLIIFLVVAYGFTYIMGLLMWYGHSRGLDVRAFPNAQMMYPAAGVMLAYLITDGKDRKMPKLFFAAFIGVAVLMVVIAVLSILMGERLVVVSGMAVSLWTIAVQYIIIIGSVVCWIFYFISGRERREAYGLKWKNTKASVLCVVLFVALYLLRTLLSYAVSGQIKMFAGILASPTTWISFFALFINFFVVYIAFLGEEYGWRYYLQPIMQRKFGLRGGVLLLGVVWGLWHLPVDFFYYSPDAGLVAAVSQQITCITLGIFFAYAYMKTGNIWVPVILHFLNNNLVPIISGNYSADVLENQEISWSQLPWALLVNAVCFGGFLFARTFRRQERDSNELKN